MLINYSISLKSLDCFVERYNEQQESRTSQIRGSMVHTAKELIRLYGVALLKANKITPVTKDHIPSLRTNNKQLGKLTKMHGRTIQRHILRLQKAGIITEKIWHGSHANFELWINPKILWIKGLTTPKKSKMQELLQKSLDAENQNDTNKETTKCPHSDTSNFTRDKKNIVIAVNKLKDCWRQNGWLSPKNTDDVTGDSKERSLLPQTAFEDTGYATGDFTGDTQLKDLEKNDTQLKEHWREVHTVQGASSVPNSKSGAEIPLEGLPAEKACDPTRHSFLVSYVEDLWKLALEKLYSETALTKRQHAIARQLLYQWYLPVPSERLEYVHLVYKERILLVEKYIKKDPESRFVTLPYRYFDPTNAVGFTGTKSWYEKDKRHKARLKLHQILHQQIQKFKRNEAKDTAVARPRLTVFLECEHYIKRLKKPTLLKDFYRAVQKKETQLYYINS